MLDATSKIVDYGWCVVELLCYYWHCCGGVGNGIWLQLHVLGLVFAEVAHRGLAVRGHAVTCATIFLVPQCFFRRVFPHVIWIKHKNRYCRKLFKQTNNEQEFFFRE